MRQEQRRALVAAEDEAASESGLRERSAGDEPPETERKVKVATFAPGREVWGGERCGETGTSRGYLLFSYEEV